jgi:penicillin-binding protein 2
MMSIRSIASALVLFLALGSFPAFATTISPAKKTKTTPKISETPRAKSRMSKLQHSRPTARTRRAKGRLHHRRYYERFYTSSFADDITDGDVITGEDPVVRAAAIEALGNMNGTVVAIDPLTGRVLAMVNQKLALSEGAQPCSTFKLAVALAGLSEGIIQKDTELKLGRHSSLNLTEAIAHSNNPYFESVGRRLGFAKVSQYAHQYGMGEMAGYNIEGEHLGAFPRVAPGAKDGGVGKMCSYGESISMTPLQLGALTAAIANGGTLYYLQHPTTTDEILHFQPRIKRQLNIAPLIPEISDGMLGATTYGTAKSVRYSFNEEDVLGKTGTCSKDGTRFGWFSSFANTDHGKVVVTVFLRGGRPTFGPKAAEIAGRIYRNLYDNSFFAAKSPAKAPVQSGANQ